MRKVSSGNRSANRGIGRRKDGTHVDPKDRVFVGVKMTPAEAALTDLRDERRDDGGRGPTLRTALVQVEDLRAWAHEDRTLTATQRATVGLLLDEPTLIADAVLEVLADNPDGVTGEELADALLLEVEEIQSAVQILAAERLLVQQGELLMAVDPPASGPGADRMGRLGLEAGPETDA